MKNERGVSMLETVIIVALVAVLTVFAFMGVASARANMRLQNSARQFAGYLEKARVDAIRRRGTSIVQTLTDDATSYTVTMDFDGDGTTETRTFNLEEGVWINRVPETITFDWRGRPEGGEESFPFTNDLDDEPLQVDVTGSGDVTLGSQVYEDSEIPEVTLNNTSVGGDVAPDTSSSTSGTTTPTPTPTPEPTPTPTPTPT
ncbi:MAG: hypothetical protein M3430_03865, partial [Acidobacteriota bacterium]|nr:hypothetical protein [Acidobacteriota bacterium]